MEGDVGFVIARAGMGQVADPGAAPGRDLDQVLLRVDLLAVRAPHQRQVPLAPVEIAGDRCLDRVSHHRRDVPDLRLGVGVAAQVPEVVPLRRGHDHRVPHEWLEQAVGDLLVHVEPLRPLLARLQNALDLPEVVEQVAPRGHLGRVAHQTEHVAHRRVARAQPLAFGGQLGLADEWRPGLHARLVGAELDRHVGLLEHAPQLLRDRDRARACRVARKEPVGVELGEDEAGEGRLERGQAIARRRARIGEDFDRKCHRLRLPIVTAAERRLRRDGSRAEMRRIGGPCHE